MLIGNIYCDVCKEVLFFDDLYVYGVWCVIVILLFVDESYFECVVECGMMVVSYDWCVIFGE